MWIKSWDGNFIVNTDRIVDIGVEPYVDTIGTGEEYAAIVAYVDYAYDGSGNFTDEDRNMATIAMYEKPSRAIEVLEMIYNHLEQGHRTFSLPEE